MTRVGEKKMALRLEAPRMRMEEWKGITKKNDPKRAVK
jgi:hypothetical protein